AEHRERPRLQAARQGPGRPHSPALPALPDECTGADDLCFIPQGVQPEFVSPDPFQLTARVPEPSRAAAAWRPRTNRRAPSSRLVVAGIGAHALLGGKKIRA